MSPVKIVVSGTIFEVETSLFNRFLKEKIPRGGKLPHLVSEAAKTGSTLTFQRPVTSFAAILEYYQTGELHMPTAVCPASFKKELEFWEIEEHWLQECCRIKFQSFLEEQSLLRDFREEIRIKNSGTPLVGPLTVRQRIWTVVETQDSSIAAKIYFVITLMAVVACILGLTLGTDSCCTRAVTLCELVEYVSYQNKPLYNALSAHIDFDQCHDNLFEDEDIVLPKSVKILQNKKEYHIKIFVIHPNDDIHNVQPPPPPPPPTDPDNPDPNNNPPDYTDDHDASDDQFDEYFVRKLFAKDYGIVLTENITLAFFTLDFLVRLWSCPSLLQFFKSALNLIDFAALVGSILSFTITIIRGDQKYETNWVDMLSFIQVFRALRLFRLVKNIRTSQVLAFSLRRNVKGMSILIVFILIFVCTFGSLIFFTESSDVVPSILDGWWWSIVTLSTVGYGDIVPETPLGRATGSICAITGIWLLSMTLPIFVNDFVLLHQYPLRNTDDVTIVVMDRGSPTGPNTPEVAGVEDLHITDGDIHRTDGANKVSPLYDEGITDAWTNIHVPEKMK